jgi:hypothetical protein
MAESPASSVGVDRRRFIKGAAGGAALVWAAPTVTGLDARAFAAGSDNCNNTGLADNFDGESYDSSNFFTPTSSLKNFTVTSLSVVTSGPNNVDVIGYNSTFDPFPSEGLYLDLAGTNPPQTAETELTSRQTFCGGEWQVTFRYSGNQRPGFAPSPDSFTVQLGSTIHAVGPIDPTQGPTSDGFTATVPAGGAPLIFRHTSLDDQAGALLLEVTVTR